MWQPASVFRMDFIQEFLALKPEVLFKVSEAEVLVKTANHTPPTTLLIMLIAIFVIVLVMMIVFMVGCVTYAEPHHLSQSQMNR